MSSMVTKRREADQPAVSELRTSGILRLLLVACTVASATADKHVLLQPIHAGDATAAADPERAALTDLAKMTNVSGWVRSAYWLSSKPVCSWALVGCDMQGRVKTLSLSFNNLRGALPASLGDLRRLEAFDVEGNHLSGAVPSTLGALSGSLLQIGIGVSNTFGGDLPPSLCKVFEAIVRASPPHAALPCDLGGDNVFRCPLPCAEAALCGAKCSNSSRLGRR